MGLVNNIEVKNRNSRLSTHPQLRFKKFRMNIDPNGVCIHIEAPFLGYSKHWITVEEGILYLKIERPRDIPNFQGDLQDFKSNKKHLDFQIALPDKQYQHLDTVGFRTNSLKIRITRENRKKSKELIEPSPMSN